jgi:hypothetical protein
VTARQWNVLEEEGAARWREAGSPLIPSALVDGAVLPILDVSQLAAALGLAPATRCAIPAAPWDLTAVLDAWVDLLPLAGDLLTAPTPSRGRSIRNLTVNTFHPIELLPAAAGQGVFPWDPDGDDEREAALPDADSVLAYARGIAATWTVWLLEHVDDLDPSLPVSSPRGDLLLGNLLLSQRWHAAFHYRQITAFLSTHGVFAEGALRVESLAGLELPPEVF